MEKSVLKTIKQLIVLLVITLLVAGLSSAAFADDTIDIDETENVTVALSEDSADVTVPAEANTEEAAEEVNDTAEDDEPALETEEPEPAKEGWSYENGIWRYYTNNESVTGWKWIGGKWYYFYGTGEMATGWQKPETVWYYLRDSGEMVTGWQKIDGEWYYFNGSGVMLGAEFLKWGDKTYFLHGSGAMAVGWHLLYDNWYYFNGSGEMATGWLTLNGKTYYFDDSGIMMTGWIKSNGKWYYLDASGAMATGWRMVGDFWYHMNAFGAMETGWIKLGNTWYYLSDSGVMTINWKKIGDKWYYFKDSGAMETGWQKIGGKWYFLSDSGAMETGWFKQGTTWYYLESSGAMVTGWKKVNDKWYFFSSSGAWTDKAVKIAICGLNPDDSIQVDDDIWQAMEDLGAEVTKVGASVDASKYDGLLIPGGIDIDPSLYGEEDEACGYTDKRFDQEQLAVLTKFINAGKPVLGICRGCELLNIYFGGSLIQDISGHNGVYHSVSAESGSTLESVCGSAFSVRSYHHQALKKLGDGFKVTLRSPDQVIEGIEHDSLDVIGVMWHPEWSSQAGSKLIEYFIYTMCTK